MSRLVALAARRGTLGAALGLVCLIGGGSLIQHRRALFARASALEEVHGQLGHLETARSSAEARLSLAEDQLLDAQTTAERLERDLEAKQRALSEAEQVREQTAGQLAEQRRLLAARRDELRQLKQVQARTAAEAARSQALAERLRDDVAALQRSSQELTRELRVTRDQLQGARAGLEQVDGQLSEARQRLVASQQALAQSKAARERLEQDLSRLRRELASARQEGEAEKARGTQLEREAAALERERDLARRKAREAESTLAKLRDAGVNVARLSGERPMPNVRATVVQVDNRAVPPTLLIDAGQVQGLEPGDELDLIRDGRRVGRIEVDELQPRLARCRLVSGQRGLSVQVGDEVKTSIRE